MITLTKWAHFYHYCSACASNWNIEVSSPRMKNSKFHIPNS